MRYRKPKQGSLFCKLFTILFTIAYTLFYNPDILYIIQIQYTLFSVYIQKICKILSDILYIYTKKCIFNCTYCLLNILRTIKYTLFYDLYTISYTVRGYPCSRPSMRLLSGKTAKNNIMHQKTMHFVVTVSHWLIGILARSSGGSGTAVGDVVTDVVRVIVRIP